MLFDHYKGHKSGDHFIKGVFDGQVTIIPYEEMGNFTYMPSPRFEFGTFSVAAGSPNHYTAWSAT